MTMRVDKAETKHEKIVEHYFNLIRKLRAGEQGSVEKLVDLWETDGRFEFAGAPPVTATFEGRHAIHVLYRNRFEANGMPLRLEGTDGYKDERQLEVALGVVDTEVHRIRMIDERVVAGWTTTIGTSDQRGFKISGSHTFTFRDGRVASLKIVVSPRADEAPNADLSLEGLAVEDIGRLSLAAWAVV